VPVSESHRGEGAHREGAGVEPGVGALTGRAYAWGADPLAGVLAWLVGSVGMLVSLVYI
jgi:hypothetical protein